MAGLALSSPRRALPESIRAGKRLPLPRGERWGAGSRGDGTLNRCIASTVIRYILGSREAARRLAILPQGLHHPAGLTVQALLAQAVGHNE